jgi:hypothetical protein
MMLLTDGTVMVQSNYDNQTWTKLTPTVSGSYVNGTWTTLAKMSTPRLYFGSNVLPDGRVFVLGGEYSGPFLNQNFTNTGEIYNPQTNKWTPITPHPDPQFGDDPTVLLPSGYILAGSIDTPETYIYDYDFDFWYTGFSATKLRNDQSDEETWLMLQDGSILSYDIFASYQNGVGSAQRFTSSFSWVDAGVVPVILSTPTQGYELGPGAVLPNGKAIVIGANEYTAIYTPPVGPGTGSWVAGPTLPAGMGADDAPGAMLPDGHFLFLADYYLFNSPTALFDYNYQTNTLTDITSTLPTALQDELYYSAAYTCRMLVLPNGGMLLTTGYDTLWEYMPSGQPQNSWRPTITNITKVNSHTYQISGARLNGISEGATYGDDAEMSTNYPIVRLSQVGVSRYARTYNWTPGMSRAGETSQRSVTFDIPPGTPAGTYYVSVIANGIQSVSQPITYTPGNVTASFSGETLSINGDSDSNNVIVTYKQIKVSGILRGATVTVTAGDAYTSINGQTSVSFDLGTGRINANVQMGAGDDVVSISSLFSRNVLVNLGDGDDTLTLQYNSVASQLYIDGGIGFDTVTQVGNSVQQQKNVNIP